MSIGEAAEKMRMLAEAMTDADAKETLLRTARDYERLAQRAAPSAGMPGDALTHGQ